MYLEFTGLRVDNTELCKNEVSNTTVGFAFLLLSLEVGSRKRENLLHTAVNFFPVKTAFCLTSLISKTTRQTLEHKVKDHITATILFSTREALTLDVSTYFLNILVSNNKTYHLWSKRKGNLPLLFRCSRLFHRASQLCNTENSMNCSKEASEMQSFSKLVLTNSSDFQTEMTNC